MSAMVLLTELKGVCSWFTTVAVDDDDGDDDGDGDGDDDGGEDDR